MASLQSLFSLFKSRWAFWLIIVYCLQRESASQKTFPSNKDFTESKTWTHSFSEKVFLHRKKLLFFWYIFHPNIQWSKNKPFFTQKKVLQKIIVANNKVIRSQKNCRPGCCIWGCHDSCCHGNLKNATGDRAMESCADCFYSTPMWKGSLNQMKIFALSLITPVGENMTSLSCRSFVMEAHTMLIFPW